MKVEAIVSRALRLIQVVDPRQSVQNVDMETGIAALNAMMRRWEANGMSLGWADVAAPDDELPVPPEAVEAIAYNLAVTLAPEYATTPDVAVVAVALQGKGDLRADVKNANPLRPDSGVLGWGYDTRSDAWY